jgi:hypothetical protein
MANPAMGDNLITTERNITVANSASNKQTAPFTWQQVVEGKQRPNLEKLCQSGYTFDKMFRKILKP